MPQYLFSDSTYTIFKENTRPRLSLISVSTENSAPIFRSLHSHEDCASILFVLEGSCICTLEAKKYQLKAGDIACINAGTLHGTMAAQKKQAYKIMGLDIKNLHLKGLPPLHLIDNESSPILHTKDYQSMLTSYAVILLDLAPLAASPQAAQTANHLMHSFLFVLYKLIHESKNDTKEDTYSLGLQIKEYLDQHYLENLKLPEIAEALHMNTYYLSHTFKKATGYAPMQYVTQRRIGEAQNMLLSTDLTVTEIAMRCGWNNSNYFQSVFSNVVGMPPGKYRKAWKSK
ncbi:AraC family transcriptional regulator [uncultured Megasphaera sp.]|uniref:AraC family transcriptional regulator n=1 Tax=uncultured Megasphaera sp. TaxID=165188 RepID=UPI002613663E|nr:AraC family transcriptional regulator [uncultured Megasphaera sp.]